MTDDSPTHMLKVATSLAQEAAELALARLGQAEVSHKSDKSIVTDVDIEIEKRLIERLAATFPEHAVLGEERYGQRESIQNSAVARYTWVIDPIDGTRNYVAGFPCFSTSIGILDRGQPVVGVVFEHNLSTLYTAVAHEGAFRNGQPMHVNNRPDGTDLLVGAPSTKDPLTVSVLTRWLATPGIVYRNLGSTAVQLALVGAGALSATFAKRCKIWDVAAGALIVQEAGGRFTDPRGRPITPFDLTHDPGDDLPFLAAAPQAHEQLLASIADLTN